MARVIGNPFGELRGKLAGSVFSKNASGPIVRQYVIPTNANTVCQNESRARFRTAVMIWKTLTQPIQQAWEVFAKNSFVPLRKVNMGQFTGNQSHNAIVTSINTSIAQSFVANWTAVPPGVDPACTPDVFVPNATAPLFSVIPNIAQIANPPATLDIVDYTLTGLGVVGFTINFIGIPVGGLAADDFIDENNKKYTFSAYISDVINVVGNRPRNQFYQRLGNAMPCTFAITTLNGLTGVTCDWDFSSLIPKFKSFPGAGQIVQITVVAVGIDGTQAVAGIGYVLIS